YQKVWLELQALAWNRPELRDRVACVHGEWRAVLLEAFEQASVEHSIDVPVGVLVTLVTTFNEGVILDRASGISEGHAELLEWIERWLDNGDRRAK
nr:hypothetical protein [Actinomycetota bacterium]